MSHIPYYGEDLASTKSSKDAFTTQEQLIKRNLKFYNDFIDLKVIGWKSYSKAMNEYTLGFYSSALRSSDEAVERLGEAMKSTFSVVRGVCK